MDEFYVHPERSQNLVTWITQLQQLLSKARLPPQPQHQPQHQFPLKRLNQARMQGDSRELQKKMLLHALLKVRPLRVRIAPLVSV